MPRTPSSSLTVGSTPTKTPASSVTPTRSTTASLGASSSATAARTESSSITPSKSARESGASPSRSETRTIVSSPSNFATPSQTQTRTKPPNTSQSPSASKGIPSPVDVAEVVSLQFRNIPMTGSFPFSESTVGSALRQALACYLSTPTSSLAVGSVLIDSVKLASTGSLLGERFKPGQAANLAPARPGCLAPSIAPPARRLAEELADAAAAGGRALQDATEPQPSPRSDLVVNV